MKTEGVGKSEIADAKSSIFNLGGMIINRVHGW